PARWRCTMAAALASARPGSLESAAAALGLPIRKDREGQRLMLAMARPRKPRKGESSDIPFPQWIDDDASFARLVSYNERDVELVTSERSRRLWDEMVISPARKISARLTVTYAGFEGESVLLEELYKRCMAQLAIAPTLHAGDGLLMFWSHEPIAPWQDERWLREMRRSLRPNQYLRMIENRFVTSESSFITLAAWDRCVDPNLRPVFGDRGLPVCAAVD